MSDNKNMISDEAVEAAAKGLYEVYPSLAIPGDESSAVPWESAHHARQYEDRKQARAALEAAAPLMLAEAWEEGRQVEGDTPPLHRAAPQPRIGARHD